jgi:hypothetical protein
MSPCEGEGSRCKSSREHQFYSFVAEREMHFFRKEDDAGATPAEGSNLLPTSLRRSAVPGDDVASSIQACEACRVGASPTHLTNFSCPMEQVNHSVCKTDATGALPVGTSNFIPSKQR